MTESMLRGPALFLLARIVFGDAPRPVKNRVLSGAQKLSEARRPPFALKSAFLTPRANKNDYICMDFAPACGCPIRMRQAEIEREKTVRKSQQR